MDDNLRNAAVSSFQKEWDGSFDASIELERSFKRLTTQIARLAEAGCHMHLQFTEPLHQEWWIAYLREKHGDMIPANPVEAPIPPAEIEVA